MSNVTGHGPKDWPEDYPHENGRYQCQCFRCKSIFYGHKRRVCCKECAQPTGDIEKDRITTGVRWLNEPDFGDYE